MNTSIQKRNPERTLDSHIGELTSPNDKQQRTRLYLSGTPVRILKGAFRGCIGEIVACTSDGVYFIQQNIECKQQSCGRMPQGPFLAEELEWIC